MSANNQTLIVRHNGKYLIYKNHIAESFMVEDGEPENAVHESDAFAMVRSARIGWAIANLVEAEDPTEYGVGERLIKDGASVTVIE